MLVVVDENLRNVPATCVYSWEFQSPGNAGIETFYFATPDDHPEIAGLVVATGRDGDSDDESARGWVGPALTILFAAAAVLALAMLILKHPFVGRRLLVMVPTLLIISGIVFVTIQLPPGDYVSSLVVQLAQRGDAVGDRQAAELTEQFHLDESMAMRYVRWMGLPWFASFDAADAGLLQGHLGRSMETQQPVGQMIGDRLLLTVLIAAGTILLTWVVAIPIGVISAVKQYSITDTALTLIGFVGMCVPGFLLALLLMYAASEWFGVSVTGLLSPEFAAQPGWSWAKVADLARHIWLPIVVIGLGSSAGMIRVMRANMLDELNKPYVLAARARGVRPMKLLLKYPLRVALNPFVSGIGQLFPMLISGGAIVAIVLSLPTVGPLMLNALLAEDMVLAGSLLMLLSLLSVVGTLVSDVLLLWLDPRIRLEGRR